MSINNINVKSIDLEIKKNIKTCFFKTFIKTLYNMDKKKHETADISNRYYFRHHTRHMHRPI